ncbi:mechanosensitive ion channel family protein [Leptolyngbya cf. ectocarpi LEGE 11479]|uniref:Mechanosensitive ion channel family protein n=1 Tax=Leptolyngbya cf. ectocarpi LEGE 11479 TaxID=1828722 RepID=A0A929F6T3_LEPEC|nr:mechanosensitive ion channel family protein [Leptolyngbya ectocarpi]MBE9068360.1 mechanosensitive ion channel family protein [Leptolyngbya cf. ectocarpi LEGE 11479]
MARRVRRVRRGAIATTVTVWIVSWAVALMASSTAMAQVTEASALDPWFNDIDLWVILQACFASIVAYGLLLLIRITANALSENVPRRFRLIIKQSVPFLKGIVLIFTIGYLLKLFVNLTGRNLIALTGTIAVALGFAFKDYASSIIAGVVNLFEGPFRMGDRVQIGEHYGEVIDYGLRGLLLQTPDDNAVTIPHSLTWTSPISNANSGQLEAQVMTEFYFAHEADTELAVEILYQAAYSSRYTQLKLPVRVIVSEETWATHLKLRAYPMDARDEFIYKTDLILRIKKACARHHIPYPRSPAEDEL